MGVMIMVMMHHHHYHHHHHRNAILVAVALSISSCRSRGWKVTTVTRTGCVWDEILVTVDGFGAAMWEKCAQSHGFGMFGPVRGGEYLGGVSAKQETGSYMGVRTASH